MTKDMRSPALVSRDHVAVPHSIMKLCARPCERWAQASLVTLHCCMSFLLKAVAMIHVAFQELSQRMSNML